MNEKIHFSKDEEFAAMHSVFFALEPLEDDARRRVINYIVSRLNITESGELASIPSKGERVPEETEESNSPVDEQNFSSFAELFEIIDPKTHADRALAAGYWLQKCVGADSFDAQSANNELKNLGYGLPNVTAAIESLKKAKPAALARQLRKSGKSQQARKTYQITDAGVRKIKESLGAQ